AYRDRAMRLRKLAVTLMLACGCDGGGGETAGRLECEPAPAPIVGGTAESDALADAAAQCGQTAFSWAREGMGEVLSTRDEGGFSVHTLTTLSAALGAALPIPPQHEVALRLITYRTQDRGELLEATALMAHP